MRVGAPEHPARLARIALMMSIALAGTVGTACAAETGGAGGEEPTFDYVIPAGTGDRMDAGEPLDILPNEIVADLDETIQIVNHDDQAHLVGPWFVGAGETLRQRFNVAGVFEGDCSIHPSGEFTVTVNA